MGVEKGRGGKGRRIPFLREAVYSVLGSMRRGIAKKRVVYLQDE